MIRKSPFIVIISLLLIAGFFATTLISYLFANNSLNDHIRTNTLPLTSDNIFSEIQRDLLQPILVSSLMAQDTFVRDWAVQGEQDIDQIVRYLTSIGQRYQTITAFFISERTHNYYHTSGLLKKVDRNNPADRWYFKIKNLTSDFEINLDKDSANPQRTTLFVNHQVHDFNGNYLGAIGVGLSSEVIMDTIDTYQARYDRQVYFADREGNIVLHGPALKTTGNIRAMEGIQELATQILTSQGGSFSYQRGADQVFLKSRFVPELNWYLLVEQKQIPSKQVQGALWINLGLSLLITAVILLLAFITLNRFQRQIEHLANRDHLTQTANRHNFESSFEQMIAFANRRQQPLSILLADIDHFKSVNDEFGHLAGDRVLADVAKTLARQLRKSDVICRWGGEEFLIVLPECNLGFAESIANKMRTDIADTIALTDSRVITTSFGVAELQFNETTQQLFERADKALYQAKAQGRNCVRCALQPGAVIKPEAKKVS